MRPDIGPHWAKRVWTNLEATAAFSLGGAPAVSRRPLAARAPDPNSKQPPTLVSPNLDPRFRERHALELPRAGAPEPLRECDRGHRAYRQEDTIFIYTRARARPPGCGGLRWGSVAPGPDCRLGPRGPQPVKRGPCGSRTVALRPNSGEQLARADPSVTGRTELLQPPSGHPTPFESVAPLRVQQDSRRAPDSYDRPSSTADWHICDCGPEPARRCLPLKPGARRLPNARDVTPGQRAGSLLCRHRMGLAPTGRRLQ